jgi:hypothetical protein
MAGAHHAREVRLAGRDKAFGLWLFPAKDIQRQNEFVRIILLGNGAMI